MQQSLYQPFKWQKKNYIQFCYFTKIQFDSFFSENKINPLDKASCSPRSKKQAILKSPAEITEEISFHLQQENDCTFRQIRIAKKMACNKNTLSFSRKRNLKCVPIQGKQKVFWFILCITVFFHYSPLTYQLGLSKQKQLWLITSYKVIKFSCITLYALLESTEY